MNSAPVKLLDLKPEEFKAFLDSFDFVFSDCDGVIWNGKPLPGAGEFFNLMKKHGKKLHFVSNNSLRTKENYENRFKAAEIENGFEQLTIPSVAIAEYLKSINFNKKVYCVSCEQSINILKSYGFECEDGPAMGPNAFENYKQYIIDDPEIGAVVMDCDVHVNLPKLNRAITYLRRPEVLFMCGATAKYFYLKPGLKTITIGAFTEIVAEESNRKPIEIGKPGTIIGEVAMRRAGAMDPSRVLFIGDAIDQDVGLGKAMGFKTLLVLTNISVDTMLSQEIKPDYYVESLGSVVSLLHK